MPRQMGRGVPKTRFAHEAAVFDVGVTITPVLLGNRRDDTLYQHDMKDKHCSFSFTLALLLVLRSKPVTSAPRWSCPGP